MKISAIQSYTYKPAKKVAFNGYHPKVSTECSEVPMGKLCHITKFYRYPKTDSFAIKKLKTNFPDEKLKILSAGCSYGEEVYTLAMLCKNKKRPAHIIGIDLNPQAIEEAKKGNYELDTSEYSNIFISRKNLPLKKMFVNDFHQVDYYPHMAGDKNFYPWGTGACYQKNDDSFENCEFRVGNVSSIDQQFEENSLNAVFLQNVIYHFFTHHNKEDRSSVCEVLKKIDKAIKPNGLLVLAPFETVMYHCDLKKILKEDLKYDCLNPFDECSVFQKPEK